MGRPGPRGTGDLLAALVEAAAARRPWPEPATVAAIAAGTGAR